jgi:hypothetical protein
MSELPESFVVKIGDIHPKFVVLNRFWSASPDPLYLLIFTSHATTVEQGSPLCQFKYLSTSTLWREYLSDPNS